VSEELLLEEIGGCCATAGIALALTANKAARQRRSDECRLRDDLVEKDTIRIRRSKEV